jgi:large subunit ribosomal protein L24
MQKLKLNDEVIVLAGKNKGKTGLLTNINGKKNTVLVAGVNLVKKAVKPTQENPNGGINEMEAALHVSNVALVSPETKKATRIRIENKDGKNVRVAVACGTVLDK